MSTEKSPDNDPKELPLVSHLVELRDRLLRCVICVLVVFLALYAFSDQIFHFVFTPLSQALTEGQAMITTKPLDSFFIPLMMTLMVAFFISIPYVMHQVWAFVAPGLYQNEIKVTLPILISSIVLFYVGIAFARFLVLPLIFNFAVNAAPDEVQVMNDISYVYDLIMRMFFVFGFLAIFLCILLDRCMVLAGEVESSDGKVVAEITKYEDIGLVAYGRWGFLAAAVPLGYGAGYLVLAR